MVIPPSLHESYSLEGEDRIIASLLRSLIDNFPKESQYFYLDIGCNDSVSLSNTFLFYNLGFKGLCVDPLEESESSFKDKRCRDQFVKAAISDISGISRLRVYSDDDASSLDETTISRYDKKFVVRDTRHVRTMSLSTLLEENGGNSYSIPFVDIDVEGMDEIIFRQVVGLEFRPHLICIENKLANLNTGYPSTPIDEIAVQSGYSLISKTLLNSFYINCDSDVFEWIPPSMIQLR